MTKIEDKELKTDIELVGIDLLNSTLNHPHIPSSDIGNYVHTIRIEGKTDNKNKLFLIGVSAEVKSEKNQALILGNVGANFIFKISNFDELVVSLGDGKVDIPPILMETLNIVSLSTLRGIMFSEFRGTFLHKAILPIIDPKKMPVESLK